MYPGGEDRTNANKAVFSQAVFIGAHAHVNKCDSLPCEFATRHFLQTGYLRPLIQHIFFSFNLSFCPFMSVHASIGLSVNSQRTEPSAQILLTPRYTDTEYFIESPFPQSQGDKSVPVCVALFKLLYTFFLKRGWRHISSAPFSGWKWDLFFLLCVISVILRNDCFIKMAPHLVCASNYGRKTRKSLRFHV